MKPIKIALALCVVIMAFGSCATTQRRNMHGKAIRAEIGKNADILDTGRTKINFGGIGYSWGSTTPYIDLFLYLRPRGNSREALIEMRGELIDFFSYDETMGGVSDRIFIEFFLEENGETILFYTLYLRGSSWKGKWHDDIAEKELRTGRSIKEFDALLGKYLDSQGIEQFRAWHPSIGTILVSFTVQDSYNLETLNTIGDELVDFIDDNWQELVDKYSRYGYLYGWVHIYINFCSKDGTMIFSIINGYNGPGKYWRWERHWFY